MRMRIAAMGMRELELEIRGGKLGSRCKEDSVRSARRFRGRGNEVFSGILGSVCVMPI